MYPRSQFLHKQDQERKRLQKEYLKIQEKMKNRENAGIIPEGDPKSFRLQAMKKIFESQKTGKEGTTELTTNMLAENLAPFSSEIYEKELAIKVA